MRGRDSVRRLRCLRFPCPGTAGNDTYLAFAVLALGRHDLRGVGFALGVMLARLSASVHASVFFRIWQVAFWRRWFRLRRFRGVKAVDVPAFDLVGDTGSQLSSPATLREIVFHRIAREPGAYPNTGKKRMQTPRT
jgi:hypothetical protein